MQALGRFSLALDATYGDEAERIVASLDAMDRGLEAWEAAIGSYEQAMTTDLAGATPTAAATMHLAIGGVYLDRGRIADALRELEEARRLDPARADVQTLLGLAYSQSADDPIAAAAAFRRASALDPDNPVRAYVLARSLESTGDADEAGTALVEFQRRWERWSGDAIASPFIRLVLVPETLGIEPFFAPVHYAGGFAQLKRGDYAGAMTLFREAAAGDPATAARGAERDATGKAAQAFRAGDVQDAARQLEAAVAAAPTDAELHRLLGLVRLADRQHAAAADALRTAVRLSPDDERARLNLADALVEAAAYSEAEQVLQETLALLPASGRARYVLGRLYQRQGQYAEALREFEQAVAFEPLLGLNGLYQTMGALRVRGGDVDRGIQAFVERIDLVPNDPGAHQELGEAYVKQGNDTWAMAEFAIVLLLDPGHVDAHAALAQAHLRAGRYAEAREASRRTLDLDPGHREARYVLATSLMRLGRAEEGREELRVFQRLQAEDAAARSRALELSGLRREAAVSSASGDYNTAVALLRQALLYEPTAPAAHLDLGLALVGAGQYAEAVERLETAAALNAPPEVHRHLAEAYATLGRPDRSRHARETYDRLRRDALQREGASR